VTLGFCLFDKGSDLRVLCHRRGQMFPIETPPGQKPPEKPDRKNRCEQQRDCDKNRFFHASMIQVPLTSSTGATADGSEGGRGSGGGPRRTRFGNIGSLAAKPVIGQNQRQIFKIRLFNQGRREISYNEKNAMGAFICHDRNGIVFCSV
jgi:hypothetical protein